MRQILLILVLLQISCVVYSQRRKDRFDQKSISTAERLLKAEATFIEAEKELILENYAKAFELFNTALELSPDNPVIHFKLAEILGKNGENNEAIYHANKAIELDGGNKYYHILAAEVYKAMGDYTKAAAVYREMIDNIEGTDTYLFDLAIIYQFQGKNDLAIKAYSEAEAIFGMNEFVLREKQKIYVKEQDYTSLMRDWDKLIEANPENTAYALELAEFLISKDLYDEARLRLEPLVESSPPVVEAELLLSQISLRQGRIDEGLRLAQGALNNKSQDFRSKLQLLNTLLDFVITPEEFEVVKELTVGVEKQYPDQYEVLAFTGDVMFRLEYREEALKYYLKALKLNSSNFGLWQNVLNIEAELNHVDSLIIHSEKALEYFPNQAILYYFSGTGHLIKKNYNQSVRILEAGKKFATDPKLLTVFYGQLGDAYNGMHKHKESDNAYERALENNPENDHVLNNYSYFLSIRSEDLAKAQQMSAKLIKRHPDNPTYLDTHGWVLYKMGEYKESLKFLEKAANLKEDGTILEHYGDVLYQLGQIEEAVKQWERASKMDDASENIDKKIADRKIYE